MKNLSVIVLCFLLCTGCSSKGYKQTDSGITTTVNTTTIDVQFFSPEIVRVLKYPEGASVERQSLSVVMQPVKVQFNIHQQDNLLQLKSAALQVTINLQSGAVAFIDLNDRYLLAEKENGAAFTVISDAGTTSYKVSQTFLPEKDDILYGLGQHQTGKLNQRNQELLLRQENMQIAVPFFQSPKGYGVFWDNYASSLFRDNGQETSLESDAGDCIDYYFMYKGNMDGVIACMRNLTGQVPMYPLWTWGYWQSRERYVSQEELVNTVLQYRKLQVPLDGIVQDWQYWSTDNAYWNAVEFGNPNFPGPEKMMHDIHQLNAHAIISVWPSFGPKTNIYKDLKDKNLLFPFETFPVPDSVRVMNIYDPRARDIYWKYLNDNIFSRGMDGWWLDATEPEHQNIKESDYDSPTPLGSFRKVRNAFPLLATEGVYTHQRQTSEEKRVYILTRSAFAGQQRYAATSWSGDIDGKWEVLRSQIPAGLNFSLCGIPYWNTDIGGFWVRDGGSSAYADYRELYVRWLQFGAFMPMMRSHGTNTPREIWQFGKKGDWAYDAIEKYIQLRYRLLPYNYALSWDVTSKAGTIMRALAMDFPEDKNTYAIDNQYMYGKAFLVCPVTQPFYVSGTKVDAKINFNQMQTQAVYLPAGAEWYDFWTGQKIAGGQTIEKKVPIDILPLYIKAGSIVPMGPSVQYAEEKKWDDLEILVYPGQDATFTLYEDENNNYNYEKGVYSTILMQWNNTDRTFTIAKREGNFPGMLQQRKFKVTLINTGITNLTQTIEYTGNQTIINFL